MADRHFPVRPNLEQLKHQAKDLLRAIKQGDPAAVAEFRKHHPKQIDPEAAKLADAQLALARSYGITSWPRLVTACRMTNAVWEGDTATVRELVMRDPKLLHQDARGVEGNWGPPMSYAANVGRIEIIEMLYELGAKDVQRAFSRACLQGKIETAQRLYDMGGRPAVDAVMGPVKLCQVPGWSISSNSGLNSLTSRAPVLPDCLSSSNLQPKSQGQASVPRTHCRTGRAIS